MLDITSDIKKGRFEEDRIYFGLDSFEYVDNVIGYGFYNEKISFFRPSYVAKGNSDTESYTFFDIDNYFIYFRSDDYLRSLLKDVNSINNGSYMIFESNGYIGASSPDFKSVKLLYIDAIQNYDRTYNYSTLSKEFSEHNSGSDVIRLLGTKSFFSYSPILSNYNEHIFFASIYNYDDVMRSNSYLINTLLILSICVFIVFISVFILFSYSVFRQEEDISLSQLKYFVRPFVIRVNTKGKIIKSNKSCKRNIQDFTEYKNIGDFPFENLEIDVSTLIKRQLPFTIKFKRANPTDRSHSLHYS